MKRLLTALLVLCLIMLCGCSFGASGEPSQPGKQNSPHVPIDPERLEELRPAGILRPDEPALKLTISINPELELTLSSSYMILDAKALNEDAEALLAEIDIIGQPYEDGIVTVLGQAKDEGYLEKNITVNVSVEEIADGGQSVVTKEILNKPITDYQQTSGVSFNCQVKTSGGAFNPNSLTLASETDMGDGQILQKYIDSSGVERKHVQLYPDGTVVTQYFPKGLTDPLKMTYTCTKEFPDGTYEYFTEDVGKTNGYIVYPDGGRYTYIIHQIPTAYVWLTTYAYYTYPDGTTTEIFYDNNELYYSISTDPDGRRTESSPNGSITYHPDGTTTEKQYIYENDQLVGEIEIQPDGSKIVTEYSYENDMLVWRKATYEDGSTWETFYKNNEIVREVQTLPNGTVIEYENGKEHFTPPGGSLEITHYPNGNEKTVNTTWPNGDYRHVTYRENGKELTVIMFFDGVYEERNFDENGLLSSHFQREQDGRESTTYYEGEKMTASVSKDADGKTSHTSYYYEGDRMTMSVTEEADGRTIRTTYYDNGRAETDETTYADGSYRKITYDRNGVITSSSGRNPDGGEYSDTYDDNGRLKESKTTWTDGNYETITYRENGNLLSVIKLFDGIYEEVYHDENGSLTSYFRRNQDGYESAEYYEDGKLTASTSKGTDGSTSRTTYYDNGRVETAEGNYADGSYQKTTYDRNGVTISDFKRDSDGTEYRDTYHDNGLVKESEITWTNGRYQKSTYDRNGNATSLYRREADGTEYVYDYKNGEPVGYTVTYPNGKSEYVTVG